MSYQNILVAVDLTQEAAQVLAAAQPVAQRSGGKLSCVSVIRPLAGVYGGFDMAVLTQRALAFEQEAMAEAGKKLADLCAGYEIDKADQHILLGGPAFEIRRLAQEMDVDLIVIGTHGRHGLGRLLGSTANAVLHGVASDVLVIRIQDES